VSRGIRPSTTQSTTALWAKSLLNALLFFAIFMVAVPLLADWLLPARLPLPYSLRIAAGAFLFSGGILLWIVCLDHFSRRGRGTPFPLDAPRELVTTGPFGIVRNPIMLAELGIVWAEALYFASFGAALYALVATLAAHIVVTRVEEPELRERFGATFDRYCRRVPRWFPSLRR
jgi:protein-S-isoprenylcysteine O-methyltransferase Ste14